MGNETRTLQPVDNTPPAIEEPEAEENSVVTDMSAEQETGTEDPASFVTRRAKPGKPGEYRIHTSLVAELERHGFDVDATTAQARWLPGWLFIYPKIRDGEDQVRYHRRVNIRVGVFNSLITLFLIFLLVAGASMYYSTNELILKPRAEVAHKALLSEELEEILANTRLAIDPVTPKVPDWLWSRFSPAWYIEDAVYSRSLDLSDYDIELLSFLREKKAIIAREIEPAYSNDKIQNRLRDPDIIYFGREYERAYNRYINAVLSISALAREQGEFNGLDAVYTDKRREELLNLVILPKPPEPNAYYDHRVDSLVAQLQQEPELFGGANSLLPRSEQEVTDLVTLLDERYNALGLSDFQRLSDNGLGPILRTLPYGWGSTNLTRAFYADKRKRFINWNVLELRLLMLDLIYSAAKLPQELPLVDLYVYHLGGDSFQRLFASVNNKKLLTEAVAWVEEDIAADNARNTREQRFIEAFTDNPNLKMPEDVEVDQRVALSLMLKAARFEQMYNMIESAEQDLSARPYLGTLGSPVADFDPKDIRPWGLFKARRNGYSHEGLDIGGDLGEPALAVMDGTIVRGGYQHRGAGNYLVLKQGNMEVTYMHLMREPSRSNYKRLLNREELKAAGNDPKKGFDMALRKYAGIVLGKSPDSLGAEELKLSYLRANNAFDQMLTAVRKGRNPKVRKGDVIANIGLSGNVTLNSARSEMIYPHIHLEINDGRIDPMKVIEHIGSRWFEIKDNHLNHPFYRNWLKQPSNWSWYSKFYPAGAVTEDIKGS